MNQLVKHPVLSKDPVVVSFLTVPTDLSVWRRQAHIDDNIEFKGQKISTSFINTIWPALGTEFMSAWAKADSNIPRIIEVWTKIVILAERHEKRQQQIAQDNLRFNEMLLALSNLDTSLYPVDGPQLEPLAMGTNNANDTPNINELLRYVGSSFTKSSDVRIDELFQFNSDILEQMKGYLDYLYSMQELFERNKRLAANNIDQLEMQIKEKEARYNKLNNEDVDAKGALIANLRQLIINDKQEMFQQLNRDWLIKQCCHEELTMMQQTQFLISQVWLDYARTRLRSQQKLLEIQDNLVQEIGLLMPVEHSSL